MRTNAKKQHNFANFDKLSNKRSNRGRFIDTMHLYLEHLIQLRNPLAAAVATFLTL